MSTIGCDLRLAGLVVLILGLSDLVVLVWGVLRLGLSLVRLVLGGLISLVFRFIHISQVAMCPLKKHCGHFIS